MFHWFDFVFATNLYINIQSKPSSTKDMKTKMESRLSLLVFLSIATIFTSTQAFTITNPSATVSPLSIKIQSKQHAAFSSSTLTSIHLRSKHHPLHILSMGSSNDEEDEEDEEEESSSEKLDPLIADASRALRRSSWLSWWAQVILTTISSVTLLFAKTVLSATSSSNLAIGGFTGRINNSGGFFLAGTGLAISYLSILWTWGETRLSRRLLRRRNTTRITAASITRRAITIGISINLIGMAMTLLGAQQIVGVLAAKALSFQTFGGSGLMAAPGNFVSQTLQPLDILIVQANTNTLLSHFISLFLMLWWGKRWVLKLDPPSEEEQEEDSNRNWGRRRLMRR